MNCSMRWVKTRIGMAWRIHRPASRAYKEIFAGLYTDPDTVLNTTFDEQHDELVLVKSIPMYSTCEHHLVSFHGVAHVGYIPGQHGRVTGSRKSLAWLTFTRNDRRCRSV